MLARPAGRRPVPVLLAGLDHDHVAGLEQELSALARRHYQRMWAQRKRDREKLEPEEKVEPPPGPDFPCEDCDKRFETCRGVFGNGVNFRGFPHMPGQDFILSGPATDGNDGGRR